MGVKPLKIGQFHCHRQRQCSFMLWNPLVFQCLGRTQDIPETEVVAKLLEVCVLAGVWGNLGGKQPFLVIFLPLPQ